MLLPGVPQDTLDFTSFTMNLGSKLVLDNVVLPAARGYSIFAAPAQGSEADPTKEVRIREVRLARATGKDNGAVLDFNDPLDLQSWHRFESEFPDTFARLYQFWVT